MLRRAKNIVYLRAGFGEPLKPKEDTVEEEENGKDGHGGDNQKVLYRISKGAAMKSYQCRRN